MNKETSMENNEFQNNEIKSKSNFQLPIVPIGTVMAFAMNDAPIGWLVCDGEMYRKELFPLLSKVLGTTYNLPDTPEGFFCVPDLQGLFIRGWDKVGNVDPEREFGGYQEDAFQGHGHKVNYNKVLTTNNTGGHSHKVYYHSHNVRNSGTFGSDYPVYEVSYSSYENVCANDGWGTNTEGSHSHNIELEINTNTSDPQNTKYGVVKLNNETRPKNIALLYCIKAENLPAPDALTETGYSTIVEKVKKELMETVAPLSRTLRVVRMGGEEYLTNIERIKQSHFSHRPSNRQDLIFVTAQCFNDICFYNARIGPGFEGFDDHGLNLLVSWIIDKGLLGKEEKNKFIGEVKRLITNLSSNITPK